MNCADQFLSIAMPDKNPRIDRCLQEFVRINLLYPPTNRVKMNAPSPPRFILEYLLTTVVYSA